MYEHRSAGQADKVRESKRDRKTHSRGRRTCPLRSRRPALCR